MKIEIRVDVKVHGKLLKSLCQSERKTIRMDGCTFKDESYEYFNKRGHVCHVFSSLFSRPNFVNSLFQAHLKLEYVQIIF